MNGTSCWGVVLKDGSIVHVHADRVWVDAGNLVFSEEKESPDAGRLGEAGTCHYTTMIFAVGDWQRTFAASVVDGVPLPVVQYPEPCGVSLAATASSPSRRETGGGKETRADKT